MQGQALFWIADVKLDFIQPLPVANSVFETIIVQMAFLPLVHSIRSITLKVGRLCWIAIACMGTIGWMRPIPISLVRCVVRMTIASTTPRTIAPTIGRWRRRARRRLRTVCVLMAGIIPKMTKSAMNVPSIVTVPTGPVFCVLRTAGRSTRCARTTLTTACVAQGRLRTSRARVKHVRRTTSVLEITLKTIVPMTARLKHTQPHYSTANARLVLQMRPGPA